MKARGYLILAAAAFLTLMILKFGVAQQGVPEPLPQPSMEAEVQWVWGEVVSVGTASNTVIVKYLDYETDTEKEMSLTANDQTTYENIQTLAELKPKDNVSIDYVADSGGTNIAKNISLEKPEITAELSSGEAENTTVVPAANNTTALEPAQ